MYKSNSMASIKESVKTDLKEADSLNYERFPPELVQAIKTRDYLKCVKLGLNLNTYLYLISPNYRGYIHQMSL